MARFKSIALLSLRNTPIAIGMRLDVGHATRPLSLDALAQREAQTVRVALIGRERVAGELGERVEHDRSSDDEEDDDGSAQHWQQHLFGPVTAARPLSGKNSSEPPI